MNIHIIYTATAMLISTKPYESWLEIQDEYSNFKTSLGPWSAEEVIEFLQNEYSDIYPPAEIQVQSSLLGSSNSVWEVTFFEHDKL